MSDYSRLTEAERAQLAGEFVSQLFAQAKADLTVIETNLWVAEIKRLGPDAMIAFGQFWMSGGGQGSFHRAPKIEDFLVRADPSYVSAETALDCLRAEVSATGPYSDPNIENLKLRAAVVRMGGWAKVCQDMPDPSEDYAFKQFAARFKSAWIQSEALQVQQKLSTQPLLGLVNLPNQLKPLAQPLLSLVSSPNQLKPLALSSDGAGHLGNVLEVVPDASMAPQTR